MPFAIFRRNQKKLIAVFGIMAMLSFVVADTLPKLLSGNKGAAADPEIATLYGKPVRRSDAQAIGSERYLANLFIEGLVRRGLIAPNNARSFGDTSIRADVDALILKHEADALGIPADKDTALRWLALQTNDRLTTPIAEEVVRDQIKGASGDQVLNAIADQLRLQEVFGLPGMAEVTPLDVFRAYRDQNEKVSAHVLPIKVADFLDKVPAPSASALEVFYDKYKDALPDPSSPKPGFKVPRRIRLEFVTLDLKALEKRHRDRLTEKELREAFEERKAELSKPRDSLTIELPVDLFAGDPTAEITPRLFEEARDELEREIARTKADDERTHKFEKAREVLADYQAKYEEANPTSDSADTSTSTAKGEVPPRPDLKALAGELGLDYESTPLLSRESAEHYGEISHSGPGSGGRGPTFAEEAFDLKNGLFFPLDLADDDHAFLAWKIEDRAPYTPTFDEARKDVEAAWRREQARPLAKAAAEKIAEAARKLDGDLEKAEPKDRVITTEPISRYAPSFDMGPARENEIPQIPDASEALRDAVFGLEPKAVAVAPDKSETVYYVVALNARIESTFKELYAPFNGFLQFMEQIARQKAARERYLSWMSGLRAKAGLKADWEPPDEAERKTRRRGSFAAEG